MKARALAIAALVHASLLVLPLAALGRGRALASPNAVACVVALVVLGTSEAWARKGVSDPSRFGAPGTRTALVSAVGLLLTAWVAIGWPGASPPLAASYTRGACAAGACAAAIGVLLRVVAIRTLGDAFTSETVLAPGRPVVRHGVYGLLDHPSDVGLLLFAAGIVGLSSSVLALIPASTLVVPSTVARMLREDRLLRGRSLAPRTAHESSRVPPSADPHVKIG
ncbi:MAG: hypothetical protein JST00_21965 [Deltaproteobacteria bacterium]|nr:hypothetical protein [Deltaproteobacteria bacterium]